jgi:hypothetical protein
LTELQLYLLELMTITIIRFFGLWLFAVLVSMINHSMSPNEYDETRQRVKDMVAAGEVDLDKVRPEFIRDMLLLDMFLRTALVSVFCMILWNIFT